jgi:hypothetical protein
MPKCGRFFPGGDRSGERMRTHEAVIGSFNRIWLLESTDLRIRPQPSASRRVPHCRRAASRPRAQSTGRSRKSSRPPPTPRARPRVGGCGRPGKLSNARWRLSRWRPTALTPQNGLCLGCRIAVHPVLHTPAQTICASRRDGPAACDSASCGAGQVPCATWTRFCAGPSTSDMPTETVRMPLSYVAVMSSSLAPGGNWTERVKVP